MRPRPLYQPKGKTPELFSNHLVNIHTRMCQWREKVVRREAHIQYLLFSGFPWCENRCHSLSPLWPFDHHYSTPFSTGWKRLRLTKAALGFNIISTITRTGATGASSSSSSSSPNYLPRIGRKQKDVFPYTGAFIETSL